MNSRFITRLTAWLPAALKVDGRERLRAVTGAASGVLVTGLASLWVAQQAGVPGWLAAPLGASAVLIFALPASPLAQPWPVIGGNTLCAVVGVWCAQLIPEPALAAPLAVAAAISLMFMLRCLHPPGGAVALLAVLTHSRELHFALMPVLVNSTLMVAIGAFYNTLTGRRYPTVPKPVTSRFSAADLDAALKHYNQVLDVSREDLEELLHHAEAAAYQRKLGELRCADIMSANPLAITGDTTTDHARALIDSRGIKALPVIDEARRLIGIITLADLVTKAGNKPAPIKKVMTTSVQSATTTQPLIELLPLFADRGHHHIPILDEGGQLAGIITQTDLVRALYRAVQPE